MSADGSFAFPAAPSPEDLARLSLNDLGNAQRLIRLVGGMFRDDGSVDTTHCRLLYLRDRGWIAFDGRLWELKGGEEHGRRWAHKVAAGLGGQFKAAEEAHGCTFANFLKFQNSSGSAGGTSAMLTQAQSYLGANLEDFDRDPLALNVANGVVRFRLKAGKPVAEFDPLHDPADRMTRIAQAAYDRKAPRPLFDAHVAFCQHSLVMRRYLQKLFGYGSTGLTDEQVFVIFQGRGGDGKSTLVNAVRETIGTYGMVAGIETFLDTGVKKGADASPDVARLAGDTRLISTGEPPLNAKLATGPIKSFTGGSPINARELRQGIFEFSPVGKVFLECNRRPRIPDTDDGIWRRLRIVLFERQVAKESIDRKLAIKLRAEQSGILNWVIEGVLLWMAEGLETPPDVAAAIEDYRRGSDPFASWVAEKLIIDPKAEAPSKDLYDSYKLWCEDEGHDRPITTTAFGRALGDMQILARKNGRGNRVRVGARLRTHLDGPSEPDLEMIEEPGAADVSDAEWEADS